MFPMSGGFMGRGVKEPFLRMWYDASDSDTLFDATVGGNPVTTNGAAVARWEDKSGNGHHLTTIGASPTLNVAAKNGLNALNFNGTTQGMRTILSDIFRNQPSAYVFSVYQGTNISGGNTIQSVNSLNFQETVISIHLLMSRWSLFPNQFRLGGRRLQTDGFSSAGITPQNENYNTHGAFHRWVDGSVDYSINNRTPISSYSTTIGGTSDVQSIFHVGTDPNNRRSPCNLCEIIAYENIPFIGGSRDDDFIDEVFASLNSKWDITP